MSGDLFSAARSARTAPSREAVQRARTPVDDGRGHVCQVCGDPHAGFGFGVFLRRGLEGRWACFAHRLEVEADEISERPV